MNIDKEKIIEKCAEIDLEYTDADRVIIDPIQLSEGEFITVVGANASYEWFLFNSEMSIISYSNVGYGIFSIALRDGITEYWD